MSARSARHLRRRNGEPLQEDGCEELGEALGLVEVADREGGLEASGKPDGPPRAHLRPAEALVDDPRSRARALRGVVPASAMPPRRRVAHPILHVVAACQAPQARADALGGLDVADERLEDGEADLMWRPGGRLPRNLEELGPETGRFLEAPCMVRMYMRLPAANASSSRSSPAAGKGERDLACASAPGRSWVMQRSARLPSAIISVCVIPLPRPTAAVPSKCRRRLLGASGKLEQHALGDERAASGSASSWCWADGSASSIAADDSSAWAAGEDESDAELD